MLDPRSVTPGSIMPPYPWLFEKKLNYKILKKKLSVMKALSVPYSNEDVENAGNAAREQADVIMDKLRESGVNEKMKDKEIIALIAYLQRLGIDMGGE